MFVFQGKWGLRVPARRDLLYIALPGTPAQQDICEGSGKGRQLQGSQVQETASSRIEDQRFQRVLDIDMLSWAEFPKTLASSEALGRPISACLGPRHTPTTDSDPPPAASTFSRQGDRMRFTRCASAPESGG
jgi:hypothetical protein